MKGPQLLRLLILLFFLFGSHVAYSLQFDQKETLDQRYKQAKFYYNQLKTSDSLGSKRINWLKGASNFRKIYLADPKSKLAPACLYMLGKIYFSMYKDFHKGIDLGESLSYYRDTSSLFPSHYLADDALYNVGKILLDEIKDPKRASKSFSRVISQYPEGDMYGKAREMLKLLSKEYNIPLPKEMVGTSRLQDLNYVLPVKYWSSNNYTRVVIKASGPVTYKEQLLEQVGKQPRRLYIDFANSYIEPKYRAPIPIQNGLLKQIRTGQFSPDTVRVVLDIESISDFKIFSLPDPFRVVVDVRGKTADSSPENVNLSKSSSDNSVTDTQLVSSPSDIVILDDTYKFVVDKNTGKKQNGKASAQTQIDSDLKGKQLSLAQQLGLGVKTIVIDPGHGGKDPGALGHGLMEKDIVLRVALKLADILKKQLDCNVILTRTTDKFIPLEERTAIANTNNADLFISLHVNAHPSNKIRGLETYFLNLSTNAEAMRVAARENATSTHQMSDLQDILSDIMKNSKINESSRLAQQVHGAIFSGLAKGGYKDTKSLGVKQAPFYVLIGAEMPAILVEMAFISNALEAKHLNDDNYLNVIAKKISEGIQGYINSTTASL